MHTEQDKADFSQRLQTTLKLAGLDTLSGANLANRFNLRHPNQPVSTQAFHHWRRGVRFRLRTKSIRWQNG